jgi:hypothetical protein
MGPHSEGIRISNCIIEDTHYGLRFINTGSTETEYCQFYGNLYAAHVVGSGANFHYNVFAENASALSVLAQSSTSGIYNNVFYDNLEAINFMGGQLNLHNNIICLTREEDKAIRQILLT